MSSKNGFCKWCMIFSLRPVKKLSATMTMFPRSINRSTKCEPTKPAPPVTSTRKRVALGIGTGKFFATDPRPRGSPSANSLVLDFSSSSPRRVVVRDAAAPSFADVAHASLTGRVSATAAPFSMSISFAASLASFACVASASNIPISATDVFVADVADDPVVVVVVVAARAAASRSSSIICRPARSNAPTPPPFSGPVRTAFVPDTKNPIANTHNTPSVRARCRLVPHTATITARAIFPVVVVVACVACVACACACACVLDPVVDAFPVVPTRACGMRRVRE
mmetsp:Transcript_5594/g.18460  ORF Transcript_5594/g.18460 Transcript_5594/m.18460 type:complete len:282 (-) Transcript_5594:22-867(-)